MIIISCLSYEFSWFDRISDYLDKLSISGKADTEFLTSSDIISNTLEFPESGKNEGIRSSLDRIHSMIDPTDVSSPVIEKIDGYTLSSMSSENDSKNE